jgi:hypothetical protein
VEVVGKGRWRRAAEGLLCVLFVVGLTLPALRCVLWPAVVDLSAEKRQPAPPPNWKPSRNFPDQFDRWYADAFGFRPSLLHWHSIVTVGWLGQSSSRNVVRGQGGWLFYDGDQAVAQYRGQRPMTPEQLRCWQTILESRRDWLRRQGIVYVYVVVPNKESVYPEHLPAGLRAGTSRLDQLLDHMRSHSDVPIVDLRPALRTEKQRRQVYFRLDTHWNLYGAYAAYVALVRELAGLMPGVGTVRCPDLIRESVRRSTGDLAQMLGMQKEWNEDCPVYEALPTLGVAPATEGVARLRSLCPQAKAAEALECADTSLPRAVVFADSFAEHLKPFLAAQFRRTALVNSWFFSRAAVRAERPDVVLDIHCERFLLYDPADEPGCEAQPE